ncbi:MAG: LapA family protein [Thermaerobacterales bacterium]
MTLTLLLVLVFGLVIALFAGQNATPVEVQFFRWIYDTSMVVVIVGATAAGALLVGLISFFREMGAKVKMWDHQSKARQVETDLQAALERGARLEGELETLRNRLTAQNEELARLHEAAAAGGDGPEDSDS